MSVIHKIAIGIVALLSLAAGAAKVMKVPQEAAFFEAVGLAPAFMTILGLLQLGAAVLILLPKSRKLGAILAALAFGLSVLMILKTGQIGFAVVSLLPAALSVFVFASHEAPKG